MIHNFANLIVLGSSLYHLVMGLACIAGIPFIAKATAYLYKLDHPKVWDPRLAYAIKPLGAFALWTSAVCGLSFFHSTESWNQWVKVFLAGLFLLRASFRVLDQKLFFEAFGVPWKRSRWNVFFNGFLALVLLASAGSSL